MDRNWGGARWTTESFEDRRDGFAGLKLFRQYTDPEWLKVNTAERELVATVTYWDAVGSYSIKAEPLELPTDLVQALIEETKAHVGV